MQTVTSKDDTRIAFWRAGAGPPLLLVHGAVADHSTTWRFILPELERKFTVYAMDRRGRGGSGDSAAYELEHEAEDVAAVVDSIGGPVNLLGHSHGALCGFEAALLPVNLRRMILYEGIPISGAGTYAPGVIERFETMLAVGDVERMLIAMLSGEGLTPEELELLRSQSDAWAVRLRNAPTIPRELRAFERYTFAPDRFKSMRTPTLFLVGEQSPSRELESAKHIAEALPDARVVVMPGQQHIAMYTAPELFVREVVRFLED